MTNSTILTKQSVEQAIRKGGSIRGAARLLSKSYTSVQWWLATNGYEVKQEARLVKRNKKGATKRD